MFVLNHVDSCHDSCHKRKHVCGMNRSGFNGQIATQGQQERQKSNGREQCSFVFVVDSEHVLSQQDAYFCNVFNPFLANVPILSPLKTPENQRFSGVLRGYKMGILARNGLSEFS